MKRIIFALIFVASTARADALWLDQPDKHAHFWLSYGLALTLTEVAEGPEPEWGPGWGTPWATLAATGVVGALGLVKELTDERIDRGDLLADGLGLLMNAAVQYTVRF